MNITPIELKAKMDRGEKVRLIDVREPEEWVVTKLPQAELIPLSQFQQRATSELNPEENVVLYCHHGMRSARAQAI